MTNKSIFWTKFFVGAILIVELIAVSGRLNIAGRLDPPTKIVEPPPHRGRWYFAADGHAVWCAGPIVKVGELDGLPHLYATRCLPGSMTVRLHE